MGKVFIYSGDGHGKSPAAIGRAIQAANEGKHVVIIQFLKGKGLGESEFVRRLEPEIKLKKSNEFTISFNRQELADYLGVERSAMSAEIGKLVKLGVLETRRSYFKLLKPME
jgi:ATP:corrinoid adenosyltransferase